jgi:uncharacterized protein (DUF1499 family)
LSGNEISMFIDDCRHMERIIKTMNAENLILVGVCATLLIAGCAQGRQDISTAGKGLLAPCPDSPNCVSSQSTDKAHRVEPLSHSAGPNAIARLGEIIKSMKRSRIVKEEDGYLHAEFRSALFGFVDDVEFYSDAENNVIHVRSASRTGYSDFGVNRKRVEFIRSKLSGD